MAQHFAGSAPTAAPQNQNTASGYHGNMSTRTPYTGVTSNKKSMLLAYILWFFFCNISAHRLYIGGFKLALPQFGLLVISGILLFVGTVAGSVGLGALPIIIWLLWVLGDVFLIPGMCRKANEVRSPQEMASHFA